MFSGLKAGAAVVLIELMLRTHVSRWVTAITLLMPTYSGKYIT